MKKTIKKEVIALITLAIPVILAQASQTAITFVETIMAGHYSPLALSGVAIGASIWLPTILFGQGLLSVLTPIIAHLNGASKRQAIAAHSRQGFIIATVLSLLIILFLYHSDKVIALRSQSASIDPAMVEVAVGFLRSIMWGAPGFLYYLVYRNQCEGLSNTKPAMVITFIALLLSIPINYIFIYGKLGMPEFGGIGCGIAATIVYWLMFIMIKCFTYYTGSQRDIRKTPVTVLLSGPIIKRIIVLGLPLAMAYFCEVSLFAIIALLIAPLGTDAVAGNQIIFSISSMTFTLPLSLGIATSIRVGFLLGQKRTDLAKLTAYLSLLMAFLMAGVIALMLILFRSFFISWFTTDLEIIALCMQLIIVLAIYQVFDYLQVTACNALRGYKDTKSILFVTLISYWIIGLPLGYLLGLTNILTEKPLGPAGFWLGITAGLCTASILAISRLIYVQNQPIERILRRAEK